MSTFFDSLYRSSSAIFSTPLPQHLRHPSDQSLHSPFMYLEAFPVELIADILGELDVASLVTCSYLSRRLRCVASDPALNPWRKPILRNLQTHNYEPALKHLSIRTTVPRHNWIDILSVARPSFLLFDATLPNLKESEWKECFTRRFLPGWERWRKDGTWRQLFLRYILLNRNGSANELQMSSRNFNPFAIFNELKLQNDLTHLETWRRVVIELADVRIIAFGVLSRPKTTLSINPNAHMLLRPPGIEWGEAKRNTAGRKRHLSNAEDYIQDYGVYPLRTVISVPNYCTSQFSPSLSTPKTSSPRYKDLPDSEFPFLMLAAFSITGISNVDQYIHKAAASDAVAQSCQLSILYTWWRR
ncbi:hypothetical protein NP233_g1519 [Leucocoprinus birnbaumii]|uniref:F-box domain-containing protein n=1 Tax=Leucocoprinus birnbaumii TaxID=56174 RepID=A0AAD5VZS9_9AGAR|nr:hypothetical protein NP233_g1519 [Leucocoprinus birnbaumii]